MATSNRANGRYPAIGRQRGRLAFVVAMVATGLLGATACADESASIDTGNLVGDWVVVDGTSVGARTGAPLAADHASAAGDFILPDGPAIEWTLRITDAAPGGFIGEWCSPKQCEPLAGAVRRDGTAVMADEDSTFTLVRYGDELELCVVSPGENFQVAACRMMRPA